MAGRALRLGMEGGKAREISEKFVAVCKAGVSVSLGWIYTPFLYDLRFSK